jgi:hypothetical protein
MRFEDIFTTAEVVLEETRVFEQPNATDFDKETRHVHRIVYQPEAFASAFRHIIEDNVRFPTRASKIQAIRDSHPFWHKHLDQITRGL